MRLTILYFSFIISFFTGFQVSANTGYVTNKNSYSGMNQFKHNFSLPVFTSLHVLDAYIGIKSELETASNPGLKARTRAFEKKVQTQFSEIMRTQMISKLSKALSLSAVDKISAHTLVVRPSVIDLEVGLSGWKTFSRPDNVIINIEMLDVLNGEIAAVASANATLHRENLFNSNGMRSSKAAKEADIFSESLTKMLIALLENIKENQSKSPVATE